MSYKVCEEIFGRRKFEIAYELAGTMGSIPPLIEKYWDELIKVEHLPPIEIADVIIGNKWNRRELVDETINSGDGCKRIREPRRENKPREDRKGNNKKNRNRHREEVLASCYRAMRSICEDIS